jgi:hypothetical protein
MPLDDHLTPAPPDAKQHFGDGFADLFAAVPTMSDLFASGWYCLPTGMRRPAGNIGLARRAPPKPSAETSDNRRPPKRSDPERKITAIDPRTQR